MEIRLAIVLAIVLVAALEGTCFADTATASRGSAKKPTVDSADGISARADRGDADAQFVLGKKYLSGDGVAPDWSVGQAWLKKAMDQGHLGAKKVLGDFHFEVGKSFYLDNDPQRKAAAIGLLMAASMEENADAQFMLATVYRDGTNVPKDIAAAIFLLNKAAAHEHHGAQLELGRMYRKGSDGVTQDFGKAMVFFRQSADNGNAEAQMQLSGMYSLGEGVPKNDTESLRWAKKAAAQGYAEAMYFVGGSYLLGEILPRDYVLSYAWLSLTAATGYSSSDIQETLELLVRTKRMTADQVGEAQKLSSMWRKGFVLARGGIVPVELGNPVQVGGSVSKRSTGTAFLVDLSGRAITNQHVIDGCSQLKEAGTNRTAQVLGEDSTNDLALIKVPGERKSAAIISMGSGRLRQGDDILVFGFPLSSVLSSGGNLTHGVVSALTGIGNNTSQLQITAPIQPGSSGSPVLNSAGEVVGVVSSKLSDAQFMRSTGQVGQNVNFAINGSTLRNFLEIHNVDYQTRVKSLRQNRTAADIADDAHNWTLSLECWK